MASATGSAGYNRAQARQLANEMGISTRAANRIIRNNAGGRAPFTPARGRNSINTNVRGNAARAARRG